MILFTGDWQVTARNLDMIKRVEDRIWELHSRAKVTALVHCGDVKHVLNPVDGRVTNYLIDMVQRMRKDFRVLILLGNHDKLSNQHDGGNWFPVLQVAGAETFDEPGTVPVGGWILHMLPFHSSAQQTKKWAEDLASNAGKKSVLVFHDTVVGARMAGKAANEGLTPKDLHAGKYQHVVSGHIHKPQQVGPVWYVGSPIAHDWGEVNQRKYFLALKADLQQLPVDLPGFFDPLLGGYLPKNFQDSIVRVSVSGPDTLLPSLKEQAKLKAIADYPGANIVVHTLREDAVTGTRLQASGDDRATIKRWVKKMVPPLLVDRAEELVSYLLFKLKEVPGGLRSGDGVQFLEASGQNVLSFEKVEQAFTPGVKVIRGHALDWNQKGVRSNGAGKTNYVQLISLALTGATMKGQTHDSWVRRGSVGPSWVKLKLKLPDGRTVDVERQRRPKASLRILVEGKPYHTGSGPLLAQKALEELTGITAKTLANSIYLDQGAVNQMLTGTDGERKSLLEKFLNLERFQAALALIKEELKAVNRQREEARVDVGRNSEAVSALEASLKAWKAPDVKKLKRTVAEAEDALANFKPVKRVEVPTDELVEDLAQINTAIGGLRSQIESAEERIQRAQKLGDTCSRCGQPVSKSIRQALVTSDKASVSEWSLKLEEQRAAKQKVQARIAEIEAKNKEHFRLYMRSLNEQNRLEGLISQAKAALKTAEAEADKRAELAETLATKKKRLETAQRALTDAENEAVFLDFAVDAFSKNGVPSTLMAEACPVLNRAADYYADLICDGQINVSFRLEGESIAVAVSNRWGGETVGDQSCGETRTASLIVSLALRETSAPCNLLIADEPGDGLDDLGAARLAQSLGEIAESFGCLYVISHNPNILTELVDYPQIVIEKLAGVSKVL